MLLGKRPRPSIKRTTSMTGITSAVDSPASDHDGQLVATEDGNNNNNIGIGNDNQTFYNYSDQRFMASMVVSPRNTNTDNYQSNNKKAVETTANFLRTCGLCTRRLAPGRDIYMYRGDTAFCSLECREQQIKQDERRDESRAIASKKDQHTTTTTTTTKSASCKIKTTVTGFLGI